MGHVAARLENGGRSAALRDSRRESRAGFTLLEMIGVLAIIGILATALVPNALRAIDRAAVKSEQQTLSSLALGLRSHLVENASLPTPAGWANALATYADQNAAAIAVNPRGAARSLIYDPASAPAQRALILSSMRSGLPIPTAAAINTAARFQSLWDTLDGEIPSTASWSSWAAWNAVEGSADFLVIERVNLRSIYLDELRTSSLALNNTTDRTASYEILDSSGARVAGAPLAAGNSIILENLAKGDRLLIHANASYSSLVYSYIVVGVDRSFDLSDWIASSPGGGGTNGSGSTGETNGNGNTGNNGSGNGNGNNGVGNGNGNGRLGG